MLSVWYSTQVYWYKIIFLSSMADWIMNYCRFQHLSGILPSDEVRRLFISLQNAQASSVGQVRYRNKCSQSYDHCLRLEWSSWLSAKNPASTIWNKSDSIFPVCRALIRIHGSCFIRLLGQKYWESLLNGRKMGLYTRGKRSHLQ